MIRYVWLFFATFTAMVGYTIHNSFWWSVANFIAAPVSWVWWFCYHEVSVSVIKNTFSWFLK